MQAQELSNAWFDRALQSAGIDRASWRPVRGVEENARTVEAVYGYYGRLFLQHPYLEWAGMAGMIGPAFFAGFTDLGFVPDSWRRAVITIFGPASRRLATRLAGDLGFYETTFLTMQKKIFEDQATMHEAYVAGGVREIEEFFRARLIDSATLGLGSRSTPDAAAAIRRWSTAVTERCCSASSSTSSIGSTCGCFVMIDPRGRSSPICSLSPECPQCPALTPFPSGIRVPSPCSCLALWSACGHP